MSSQYRRVITQNFGSGLDVVHDRRMTCCHLIGHRRHVAWVEGDGMVSGSKMTSRGNRFMGIVAEQTAEACAVLDPTTGCMHRIVAGRWGS